MSFKEVLGHDVAIEILKKSLEEERRGLSYLFYGPAGVGKLFTARQFAKSLNCETQSKDCCDICGSCLRADNLQYPDLHCLDIQGDADKIKIEQIRQIQNDINLKPFEGRIKVFIIDKCEQLTLEAANCLLKMLEEPPQDTVLILITSNLRMVIPTVISRCQKIKFSSLKRMASRDVLVNRYKLDEKASHYLAYYLDGRIGAAINLSGNNFLLAKNIILDKFMYGSNKEGLEELFKDKAGGREALSVLMSWFRDLLFVNIDVRCEHLINIDRINELKKYASRYSHCELLAVFGHLNKSLEFLEKNVNSRLLVDNLKAKIWKS